MVSRSGTGVGRREQDPGQFDPAALAAGQRAQRLGQNPFGQAETRTDAARLAFGGIPAERGEPLFELAVAADGFVAGGVVGDLGHQGLLLLQIGQQRVEAAGGQHAVARQHVEVALSGILWQITDFTGARDRARVRLAFAGEDAHGGGLAGAVAADQPDAVAGLHPQRRSFGGQQRARAGADLEVRCGDHAAAPLRHSRVVSVHRLLVVGEDRGPLLGARRDRFFEVGGEQTDEELSKAFGLHVPLQATGIQSTPQCALGQLDSRPGERRDPLGHLVANVEQVVIGHGARHQADAFGFVGVDVTSGQHELEGPRRPDRPGQQIGQTRARWRSGRC